MSRGDIKRNYSQLVRMSGGESDGEFDLNSTCGKEQERTYGTRASCSSRYLILVSVRTCTCTCTCSGACTCTRVSTSTCTRTCNCTYPYWYPYLFFYLYFYYSLWQVQEHAYYGTQATCLTLHYSSALNYSYGESSIISTRIMIMIIRVASASGNRFH